MKPFLIGFGLLLSPTLAQQPLDVPVKFEVASLRPSGRSVLEAIQARVPIGLHYGSGHLSLGVVTLGQMARLAYGLTLQDELVGPEWVVNSNRKEDNFDLEARFPEGTSEHHALLMLQTLLADRFQLRVRMENTVRTGSALVIAKGGHKLKERDPAVPRERRPGYSASTTQELAGYLTGMMGEPVADETGLKGACDLFMEPARLTQLPEGGGSVRESMRTDALEQLRRMGLNVETRKVTGKRLVVESADRTPSEN
jgi:uncharacterized protein (TIGR03435 family)